MVLYDALRAVQHNQGQSSYSPPGPRPCRVDLVMNVIAHTPVMDS